MRQDALPPEFNELSSLVSYVHRKSANEYSSSCPQCLGTPHNGGDPDRFVMFRVGRRGTPYGWCRKCGFRWYPNKGSKPSQDDIEYWRKQQIEVEKARKEAAERALFLLQEDRMWEQFYEQNNTWSRGVFKERGIAESWIEYLKLGLIPDYVLKSGQEQYHSPAFTIPTWNVGAIVRNIKLRVANPRVPRDRYRNFYSMAQSFLFIPLYDVPLYGAGVIVEGEYKAIVVEQHLDNVNYRVVGLQSKTPSAELFGELKDLDPVYIALDPDASEKVDKQKESAVEYVTRIVGKERARIVELPVKPDDGIIQGMNMWNFIRMAKKA